MYSDRNATMSGAKRRGQPGWIAGRTPRGFHHRLFGRDASPVASGAGRQHRGDPGVEGTGGGVTRPPSLLARECRVGFATGCYRVTHRDLDRSRFADMQCEQSDKGTEFGRWRFTGGSGVPSRLRPVEGFRTMTLNFAPNGDRHDHLGKIPQQVWTVQLIQRNDRTGIADDRPAGRFSVSTESPSDVLLHERFGQLGGMGLEKTAKGFSEQVR